MMVLSCLKGITIYQVFVLLDILGLPIMVNWFQSYQFFPSLKTPLSLRPEHDIYVYPHF